MDNMDNVLRLNIGSKIIDKVMLRALLQSLWPTINKMCITQKATYVVFPCVEDSVVMLKSKSFHLEDSIVQVQALNGKTKKHFKNLCKNATYTEIPNILCEDPNNRHMTQNKLISLQDFQQPIDIKSTALKNKLMKYSNGNKIEEFLIRHPNLESSFQHIFNEEEEKLNAEKVAELAEYEYQNECMFKDLLKLVFHNTANLEGKVLPGYKYKLKQLEKDNSDYKLLKGSLGTHIPERKLKIYRVLSNENIIKECSISAPSKLLLLHGTKGKNIEGILKYGFKPSTGDAEDHGPGVYMTNSVNKACVYGEYYGGEVVDDETIAKTVKYLFVNKVLPTIETDSDKSSKSKPSYNEYITGKRETKVLIENGESILKESPQDKFDSENNRILKGTFQSLKTRDILSHHDVVVPAYIIEIHEDQNINPDVVVNHILYNIFKVEKVNDNNSIPSVFSTKATHKNMLAKDNKCNFENIKRAFDKETSASYMEKLNFLQFKFEYRLNTIMQQMSFEVNSLSRRKPNKSFIYQTELMEKEDKDYQIILNSVTDKNSNFNPKVLQLYNIKPSGSYKIDQFRGNPLCLHGVKANKVNDLLQYGYPKKSMHFCGDNHIQDRIDCIDFSLVASSYFDQEVLKGSSYCKTDGGMSKLSFVFVLSKNYVSKSSQNEEADSRGCFIPKGTFRRYDGSPLDTEGWIPVYLIVFKLKTTDI